MMSSSQDLSANDITPWISEIMTYIGAYLTPPDLLSVVCVCRHWNRTFIPLLWHNINDSLYNWPNLVMRILPTLEAESEQQQQEETARIRRMFEKYGCHIRQLFLSRLELLTIISEVAMAASTGGGLSSCTQLQDLEVSLVNLISPKEQAENKRIKALTQEEQAVKREQARAIGMPLVLSPVLEGVFEARMGAFRNVAKQIKDWESNQRFWLLVRQNRQGIRSLSMSWSIMGSCRIVDHNFLYHTLGEMKQLKVLRNDMVLLGLNRLMRSVPMLEKYSTWSHLIGSGWTLVDDDLSIGRQSMSLKVLEIWGPMGSDKVGELLRRFAHLDRLSLGRLVPSNTETTTATGTRLLTDGEGASGEGESAGVEQNRHKSRLKELEINLPRLSGSTVNVLLDVLRLVPYLTTLSIKELDMETATAIGRGCEFLETFSLWIKVEPNPANQEQLGATELNALNVILQSCSRLKWADASRCMIAADDLLDNQPAWVCQSLELLRCRIVGFYCLTDEEQEVIQTINGPDFVGCKESDYERKILQFSNRRQEQHMAVYGRIASLMHLVTLDLASRYRYRPLPGLLQPLDTARKVNALEVSLLMGLERLSTLGCLEEFGFEGQSFGIGESELEWMVKSWPRLKVVRGLQERALDDVATRQRKARLREVLEQKKASILLSCVQVSSLWHSALSASLWHTIDDTLYSWKHYLEKHDSEEEAGEHDTQWVMGIFAKYGHHIRELSITWKVLISAAFEGGACSELVSLRIHALFYETKREVLEKRGIPVGRSYAVKPGPFLSPIFKEGAVLKETWSSGRSERQQQIDWLVVQQYWLLIRQNLGLRSLDIRRMPQWMGGLAQETFFYETVGLLDRLVDLGMDDFEVDLNLLLVAQPKLQRFRTSLNLHYRHTLTTLFPGLRLVECKGYISPLNVATLLGRIPGLEEMRLYSFLPGRSSLPVTTLSAQIEELKAFIDPILSSPSNLQTFFLEKTRQGADVEILKVFLPWWPSLKRLLVTGLTREIAFTAIKFCPLLEHVGETMDPTSIFPDHQRKTDHNIPTLFLKSCPQLRVINGIKLAIDVHLDPHAVEGWICPQLRTLRCQIIGLPRLTKQERIALDTQPLDSLSPSPASIQENLDATQEEKAEAAEARINIQTFQKLHHQIYDQLAQLTNLRRLILGFEFRDFYRLILYSQGSYPVWNYDDPVPGTLEFSLASGLGRLSTLKNLEEFGFEGLDHRIGRLEIEWMAANWPQLRVLRGVADDKTSGRAYAKQKQLIREHMHSLRPEIIFE
ncbi:hypothetical protein BG015_007812 [Linnemannia schmuckeri]|uniref:F-box domain-containing protein n=1 Tax=Linnemannia schmuckeri TaxID=64567 RepID=A0A9P5S1G7_9FUNG|nr:hypothetical protein BG015_007812 [Linnemannia schmuckeri]